MDSTCVDAVILMPKRRSLALEQILLPLTKENPLSFICTILPLLTLSYVSALKDDVIPISS
jgi:L-cystine uptake protein TcyP (sodium:dicarboxylate symporter family)